jgi:hypothetical protein
LIQKNHQGTLSKVPYLPASLVSTALDAFHDHPFSGHFGTTRTYTKIKKRYWWPQMRPAVEQHIASCD